MQREGAPALSIVVPVYNGEKCIAETIKNILRLTDIAFELLLIDDGSTDGSAGICRACAAQDARIRYIYQENAGIAAARGRGLELAEGEYICFWDQDDIPLPDGVAALLSNMRSENAQMGICSSRRFISAEGGRNGRKLHPDAAGAISESSMPIYEKVHDAVYHGEKVRTGLLYPLLFRGYDYTFAASGDYMYGSVWKCIFLLSFVRANGIRFERFVSYEDDWIFVTHALSLAECVVTSSAAGYCWRVNPESESHRVQFIPDLTGRFGRLDAYVSSYIYSGICDQAILQAHRQITFCEHYVDLVRNDAGIVQKADRAQYRRDVRRYLEETDYRANLQARKHLKSSAYRKKLILVIISIAGIRIAYIMSRVYDVLERRLERIGWIARLERRRKMSSRRSMDEADHSDSLL